MAYKTLIFGTDDLFLELQPLYMQGVHLGNLEIVGYAVMGNKNLFFIAPDGKLLSSNKSPDFDIAIISSRNNFYQRMKFLEARGIPRKRIIDGRIFQIPELNFPRLIAEGVAYGVMDKNSFGDITNTIYPRIYKFKGTNAFIKLGAKSRINNDCNLPARLEIPDGTRGVITFGNFSAISWNALFQLGWNVSHNYRNVHTFALGNLDWNAPAEFWPRNNNYKIDIGSDVWIGRGCTLKCTNPDKPLIIGDGAVIAADSVVVKNVPPYAIVGGNPAQIIKYRFKPEIIEALLRIKWWDWSLDKIHDNFRLFNDVEKFISLHDRNRLG